ncbi:MAG: hypothetical protein UX45_C0003G0004 [Candidatus Uhrbacteria bacterium GW2011_GWF2_46_218]|uniref:Uncharacterized protein n=2 Tax=Candidatus Uhriibacteriota TaxID=1752732 RepID=A0A0G1RVY9_9BACT|nr:MAG: hypothetical protein UX45_C0003G0004 [Candidatus Uhrbacteria bacterium GW2011_GWF2_46_218]
MSPFFRSPETVPSMALHEAILSSVSSVRDSLPEQHHAHFETLRQEIIDFTKVHGIPKESLTKPAALREATSKFSTQDLERLADLLERFEYLVKHKEPKKKEIDLKEAIEYAEAHYHLKEQYDSQVEFLEDVGILESGAIPGIDGNTYPIPTLEQIAMRLFERRETLHTKHDQGFTKLLLVPFEQFLLKYKKDHPSFDLNTDHPLFAWEDYQGGDMGDFPNLVYYPQSFDLKEHQGKTKIQILKANERFPGWTVHLLQPSDPTDSHSLGFASIPRKGEGTTHGKRIPRPSLEVNKTLNEHLSTLQKSKDDPDSPYFQEFGLTPEDWILAFMIHLKETEQPMDDWTNGRESMTGLIGSFFQSVVFVPCASWYKEGLQVDLRINGSRGRDKRIGVRSSVII